ncbi:MAG: IS200/IS605 family element RNA-guided endonuclease TnpB [Olsenella sp.]|nr:IS200/IS605 family element RNA-guided endonuclease TnpB [Olsenella sp.]
MERAYEIRIYPNAAQRELIERTFGCTRWVYNRCLEARKAEYERTGRSPSVYQLQKLVTAWKRTDAPWLGEVDSHALQQAVVNLGRAFDGFFRRCRAGGKPGYPRFKSKRDTRQSYRTNWGVAVPDARHVRLPKLGLVRARVSRPVEGRVLNATVKRVPSGKYFCVLCCTDCPKPDIPEGRIEVLGVDVGIRFLMARSDGTAIANPKSLARSEKKLAQAQRRLSRKKKGSRRRARQRARVARVHEKIANQRKDALHKATTEAVRESQAIAVEDLDVKGMEQNRRLAKSVADASMSEMARQLEYKCSWYGRKFVKVSRFYPSSRTCSVCGQVNQAVVLGVEAWTCPACGCRHDRDLNAALNIAREGARLLDRADGTAGLAGTEDAKASRTLVEQA